MLSSDKMMHKNINFFTIKQENKWVKKPDEQVAAPVPIDNVF